jgi:hypothetical protein
MTTIPTLNDPRNGKPSGAQKNPAAFCNAAGLSFQLEAR